ncbi:MAG: pilus assembly protein PilM [Planctomycetota bacterium]|nr:pilus assembly protein PilM [Planctomycetota bacterium]
MRLSQRMLGLTFRGQAIAAAEVTASHGRYRLERAAVMPLPPTARPEEPEALGLALKGFLRERGFSARRCVIALEAGLLATKEKRLPEAAAGNLAEILRLAAEQDFAGGEEELAFDYVPAPRGPVTNVLLVAAPRRSIDQSVQTARAAGLAVAGVTASATALAGACGAGPERIVLATAKDGSELVMESSGGVPLVRRLAPGPLEAQLQRALAAGGGAGATELLVWGQEALDETARGPLAQSLRLAVRAGRFPLDLGLEGTVGDGGEGLAGAAAAARAGARGETLAPDFLHSRLARATKSRIGRPAVWGMVAGVCVVAAMVWYVMDWRRSQSEIDDLQRQVAALEAPVKTAQGSIERTGFARGWFDQRPPILDCLRAVTRAFPEDRIWATRVEVHEDLTVSLAGKAAGKEMALLLVDRLNAGPSAMKAEAQYIRLAGQNSQDVAFVINIRMAGGK